MQYSSIYPQQQRNQQSHDLYGQLNFLQQPQALGGYPSTTVSTAATGPYQPQPQPGQHRPPQQYPQHPQHQQQPQQQQTMGMNGIPPYSYYSNKPPISQPQQQQQQQQQQMGIGMGIGMGMGMGMGMPPTNTLKRNSSSFSPSNKSDSSPLQDPGSSTTIDSNSQSSNKKRRRRYSPQQDETILRLKHEGKSWEEISDIACCDSPQAAKYRYHALLNQHNQKLDQQQQMNSSSNPNSSINPDQQSSTNNNNQSDNNLNLTINSLISSWDPDDIEALINLLELGERAKWKYISAELSNLQNKRITSTACQKKFKEMFGVAESLSTLGSSLCYVVADDGWLCLDQIDDDKNKRKNTI